VGAKLLEWCSTNWPETVKILSVRKKNGFLWRGHIVKETDSIGTAGTSPQQVPLERGRKTFEGKGSMKPTFEEDNIGLPLATEPGSQEVPCKKKSPDGRSSKKSSHGQNGRKWGGGGDPQVTPRDVMAKEKPHPPRKRRAKGFNKGRGRGREIKSV